MNIQKIEVLKSLIANAEANILQAKHILKELLEEDEEPARISKNGKLNGKIALSDLDMSDDGKIVEGVFDGESMVGPDHKKYSVPPNYASKSKLVYGDRLKLIIGADGSFTYKQIGPIDRKYTTGILMQDNKTYKVLVDGRYCRVLAASVSYYRAQPGDDVAVIMPATLESDWVTLDNIIPKTSSDSKKKKESKRVEEDEEGEGSPFEIPKTLFSRRKTTV